MRENKPKSVGVHKSCNDFFLFESHQTNSQLLLNAVLSLDVYS